MKPVINKKLLKAKNNPVRNDTAYYIFDRDNILPFRVGVMYHKMKYGSVNDPILGLERSQVNKFTNEMVSTHGPVIDLVDYFIEGATLDIPMDTMLIAYDRIDRHLEAHARAMRESSSYFIGDTFEVFEQLVEFGTSIYLRIKDARESNRQSSTRDDPMASLMGGRASFMTMVSRDQKSISTSDEDRAELERKARICPLIDRLERMKTYYQSAHSWRDDAVYLE